MLVKSPWITNASLGTRGRKRRKLENQYFFVPETVLSLARYIRECRTEGSEEEVDFMEAGTEDLVIMVVAGRIGDQDGAGVLAE